MFNKLCAVSNKLSIYTDDHWGHAAKRLEQIEKEQKSIRTEIEVARNEVNDARQKLQEAQSEVLQAEQHLSDARQNLQRLQKDFADKQAIYRQQQQCEWEDQDAVLEQRILKPCADEAGLHVTTSGQPITYADVASFLLDSRSHRILEGGVLIGFASIIIAILVVFLTPNDCEMFQLPFIGLEISNYKWTLIVILIIVCIVGVELLIKSCRENVENRLVEALEAYLRRHPHVEPTTTGDCAHGVKIYLPVSGSRHPNQWPPVSFARQ